MVRAFLERITKTHTRLGVFYFYVDRVQECNIFRIVFAVNRTSDNKNNLGGILGFIKTHEDIIMKI